MASTTKKIVHQHLCACLFFLGAPPVIATDLVEVLTLARENDAVIAAAQSALESSKANLPLARSVLKPKVDLSGSIAQINLDSVYDGVGPFTDRETDFQSSYYELKISQALFHKNDWETVSQTKLIIGQSEIQYQIALQQLTLKVAASYFEQLLAQYDVELARIEKESSSKQLQRAKRAYELGGATITDVHAAQASFDTVLASTIAADNQLAINRQKLFRYIGRLLQDVAPLKKQFDLTLPTPNDIHFWTKKAQKSNLVVQIAQQRLDIANVEIKKIRGIAMPTLDLVASYRNSQQDDSSFGVGIDATESRIALDLKIPIYSGGAVSAKLRSVNADKNSALHLLEDTRRDAVLQAQQLFLSITNGVRQISALKQVVISSESSYNPTQKGMQLGLRTLVDVLAAQQALFQAKRNLAAAKYLYLLNRMRLKATVNELDIEMIKSINALLIKS